MKIKLLSDVHTEFWTDQELKPGTGEVLILAGDIGLVSDLGTKHGYIFQQFLELCASGYEKVFYVMGNHEHYHFDVERTADTLRTYLPGNFTLLDDSSEFFRGVHFVGGTMWADFEKGNKEVMWDCQQAMTDYHLTLKGDRELTPKDTLKLHEESVEWFDDCLDSLRGPVVVITHHAPSFRSVTGRYADSTISGAYYSDRESMIMKYPNIVNWCHGHVHRTSNYYIGECNVIANPFGYHPDALNEEFSKSYEFEVIGDEHLSENPCQGLLTTL